MIKQNTHIRNCIRRAAYRHIRIILLMGGLFLLLLPACEHDPVAPIDPDPDPMDTMDVDTMDEITPGVPCNADSVYFERDLLPILKSNCAKSGCHDAISHEEDIMLDTYENVMASGIVKPYNFQNSDLYEVITETDPDKRMPQSPNQNLTAEQIDLISKWIQQGAKDLACDDLAGQCDTINVTYSGYVAPLFSTYCIGCHSGGQPSGNINLSSHAGVQSVALNGRLIDAITWVNEFKMPKGSAKFSDCKIDKIKAWINNGAPNN